MRLVDALQRHALLGRVIPRSSITDEHVRYSLEHSEPMLVRAAAADLVPESPFGAALAAWHWDPTSDVYSGIVNKPFDVEDATTGKLIAKQMAFQDVLDGINEGKPWRIKARPSLSLSLSLARGRFLVPDIVHPSVRRRTSSRGAAAGSTSA